MKSQFSAIVFDLDGTLTDSMDAHRRAWDHAFHSLGGFAVPGDEIYRFEGVKSIAFAEAMVEKYSPKCPATLDQLVDDYASRFREEYSLTFFAGAEDLVRSIAQSGIKIALVSGAKRVAGHFVDRPDFLEMFDAVVSGDDTKIGKPAPDPYLLGFKLLGVPAAESLVIENAPLGLQSARAAGAACWAVRNNSPLSAEELAKSGA